MEPNQATSVEGQTSDGGGMNDASAMLTILGVVGLRANTGLPQPN